MNSPGTATRSGIEGDIRKLNLLWHAVLPGGVVVVLVALYGLVRFGEYQPPPIGPIADVLPGILAAVFFTGAAATMVLKSRLPSLVSRSPSELPVQRVTAAMFTLLGVADSPAIIAIAVFMMAPSDEIAVAILAYAFVAAYAFKPDFAGLLSAAKSRA